jgi:hypothetical protein
MKNYLLSVLCLFALLLPVSVFAQDDSPIPPNVGEWLPYIIAIIVAVFDVVARLIPKGSWKGIVGLIIDVLKWVSDTLNRKESVPK